MLDRQTSCESCRNLLLWDILLFWSWSNCGKKIRVSLWVWEQAGRVGHEGRHLRIKLVNNTLESQNCKQPRGKSYKQTKILNKRQWAWVVVYKKTAWLTQNRARGENHKLDERLLLFDGDPINPQAGQIGHLCRHLSRFPSPQSRAHDESNIWACAVLRVNSWVG